MNVVNIKSLGASQMEQALDVIDDLRLAVEQGRIKAFVCVGVDNDSRASQWSSQTRPVSALEMLGAVQQLARTYQV